MQNILNNEEVLCSINVNKEVKKSVSIANVVTNLFTGGVAGGIVNNFKLILTMENLYIQAIENVAWGGLQEVLYMDKIAREDIKLFDVQKQDDKEIITITTTNDKITTFIRENEGNKDLALIMAAIVAGSK